jgi:two-component system nitrate/nitrite sensor histidine kinase NarX
MAETLPRLLERGPTVVQHGLINLHRLTRGALAEMRTLLLELRPTTLQESALEELLGQLVEAVRGKTDLAISLKIAEHHQLPSPVKITLFRIVQESLNNIVKHAQATQVIIMLDMTPCASEVQQFEEYKVKLYISDDGCGFDPQQVSPGHLGLGIMRERVESIDGIFNIFSQQGQGTQITVIWSGKLI